MPSPRHRVVVADDSGFMRKILITSLERAGIEVVGVACDGDEALALCREKRPDVLSLDLAMPGRDGMAVLRELREQKSPIPVVVVSAFSPAHGARAVDALAEGAIELVSKPAAGESLSDFSRELAEKVTVAAQSRRRFVSSNGHAPAATNGHAPAGPVRRPATATRTGKKLVLIACSTGGPRALGALVPNLPAPLGAGTLIVQHMPPGFTSSLAQRLDGASKLNVLEAKGGEAIEPGKALLAPGGSHLRLDTGGKPTLSDDAPIGGLRPRADLTIADAAKIYKERLLLVVLTGMGKDGLDGAREVRRHGGRILGEAERTCTVYGMPRAIAEAGLADAMLDLPDLAPAIAEEAGR